MKTGSVPRMTVPDEEGLATDLGLESGASDGNSARAALTGVCAGWVWSLEIGRLPGADVVLTHGRPLGVPRKDEGYTALAGSATPCMHRSPRRGNRESPCLPAARTAGRHGFSEDTCRRGIDTGSWMGA
jgi:hypothetical protein